MLVCLKHIWRSEYLPLPSRLTLVPRVTLSVTSRDPGHDSLHGKIRLELVDPYCVIGQCLWRSPLLLRVGFLLSLLGLVTGAFNSAPMPGMSWPAPLFVLLPGLGTSCSLLLLPPGFSLPGSPLWLKIFWWSSESFGFCYLFFLFCSLLFNKWWIISECVPPLTCSDNFFLCWPLYFLPALHACVQELHQASPLSGATQASVLVSSLLLGGYLTTYWLHWLVWLWRLHWRWSRLWRGCLYTLPAGSLALSDIFLDSWPPDQFPSSGLHPTGPIVCCM